MTAWEAAEPTTGPVLEVTSLTKRYGWRTALGGVSFRLWAGECLLILGPNGSGKTTLVRLLVGLARPSSGTIAWFGREVTSVPLEVRQRLGVVMHRTMLDPELTVLENLSYYARLYRIPDATERIQTVASWLGIEERLRERVRQLSRGFQQRVALARAVLHRPSVLLLDEPDTGLDRASRARVLDLLRAHRERGGAVLMTTHALDFALEAATRALYLERGRIVYEASNHESLRVLAATVSSTVPV